MEDVPLKVFATSVDVDSARSTLWKAPQFRPPFQVALAPFGEGEAAGALVQLQVTHMLSDGYSIVPLLADLAHFVALAEGTAGLAALPPLPNVLLALEPRIARTIDGDDALRDTITSDPLSQSGWNREAFTEIAELPEGLVSAIRSAARCLAVSEDILMLAVIGTTLARFEGQPTVPITMIAPQRDGPSFGDMIGFFADIRHFTVGTGGLSYAGVALQLHHTIKERRWQAPPIATQYDSVLVNFEWTDLELRQGFTQHVLLRQGPEQLTNPMKLCVDQPTANVWRLRATFDSAKYSQACRQRFFAEFRESLSALVREPLRPVWTDPSAHVQPETLPTNSATSS